MYLGGGRSSLIAGGAGETGEGNCGVPAQLSAVSVSSRTLAWNRQAAEFIQLVVTVTQNAMV